ncbi:glycoside hydrolase family 16 protein [Pseudoalteromonas sp. SIMBA_148]
MYHILIISIFALFSVNVGAKELIWSDEFDIDGLPNPSKWHYEKGYVRNGEAQHYQEANSENSRIENGFLVIESHYQPANKPENLWQYLFYEKPKSRYSSASLTTEHLPGFEYGRIEVRAKLPQGRGVWPAIWLLGSNIKQVGWPMCGEIDIMEYVGFEPNKIHSAIHTSNRNHNKGNAANSTLQVNDLENEFHVYSVERSAERVDFYIDNSLHYSYHKEDNTNTSWPFDQPMYLIINLAIGGGWGGKKGIDNTIFPQQFFIDYVRVYK